MNEILILVNGEPESLQTSLEALKRYSDNQDYGQLKIGIDKLLKNYIKLRKKRFVDGSST